MGFKAALRPGAEIRGRPLSPVTRGVVLKTRGQSGVRAADKETQASGTETLTLGRYQYSSATWGQCYPGRGASPSGRVTFERTHLGRGPRRKRGSPLRVGTAGMSCGVTGGVLQPGGLHTEQRSMRPSSGPRKGAALFAVKTYKNAETMALMLFSERQGPDGVEHAGSFRRQRGCWGESVGMGLGAWAGAAPLLPSTSLPSSSILLRPYSVLVKSTELLLPPGLTC